MTQMSLYTSTCTRNYGLHKSTVRTLIKWYWQGVLYFGMTSKRSYARSTWANLLSVSITKNTKLKDTDLENFCHTCCIICGNSEQRVFRPWSSNIFSSVMSCSATKVVSSMSSPAWFANVKTGNACINWMSDSLA